MHFERMAPSLGSVTPLRRGQLVAPLEELSVFRRYRLCGSCDRKPRAKPQPREPRAKTRAKS